MSTVVGVALVRAGRVLAARRSGGAVGGWEFPGGKVEPGEDHDAAAVREIAEELGCTVRVTGWLESAVEVREGLELRVALAEVVGGEPVPAHEEHDAIRWLDVQALRSVGWLPADLPFVGELSDGGHLAAH